MTSTKSGSTHEAPLLYLSGASKYVQSLSSTEQAKVRANAEALADGDIEFVHTKPLTGKVRELIVGHHRLTYFRLQGTTYFARGFRKKSQKTPKKEIQHAEQVYKRVYKAQTT